MKTPGHRAAARLLLAALSLLAGPLVAHGQDFQPRTEDATAAFRACYAEAKLPWLADRLTPLGASPNAIEEALKRLGVTSPEAVEGAKAYVLRRREGGFPTSEDMAASAFADCSARRASSVPGPAKAAACFRDQHVLLEAADMRFGQQLSEADAKLSYLASHPGLSQYEQGSAVMAIHDAYVVMAQDQVSAFFEAEFQFCMNGR